MRWIVCLREGEEGYGNLEQCSYFYHYKNARLIIVQAGNSSLDTISTNYQ
jgi:hypothetical protein